MIYRVWWDESFNLEERDYQDSCLIKKKISTKETISPLSWFNNRQSSDISFSRFFWLLWSPKLDKIFLLCSVWRILAEYKWDSHQACGQGEWRTKSKNWRKNTMLRAPKICLNYTAKCSGWLDDDLLYSVTREIVQAELMFSSRERAGLEDSFQQIFCLMFLGGLDFSGLAHSMKVEQYCTDQEWQIDFPLHANSNLWVVDV